MIYISLLGILILSLLLLCAIILFLLMTRDTLVNKIPFIPVRGKAVSDIISALQLTPTSTLYDLGCGDARVLIAAQNSNPGIKSIGIENGIIPYLVAKMRTKNKPIDLRFTSFFDIDMSDATHIFCYLSNPILGELQPKILKECKKGTRIVSCDFTFENWPPVETFEMQTSKHSLAKTLYMYVV